jgi:CHAT domain-containing protein
MDSGLTTRPFYSLALLCVLALITAPQSSSAQSASDPLQLQKDAIARIDRWLDYVRSTGDAVGTRNELAAAQTELQGSVILFAARHDAAGATLSLIKLGDILRYVNQWGQAVPIYQEAIKMAVQAGRTDYQTKALAQLAYSEMKMGMTDAAEGHADEAVRLGANCGNNGFYFDALDVAGEVEEQRGNLVAAGDYIDRALTLSGLTDDKKRLYAGYFDRADIYHEDARKCDYKRGYDVCYQLLELARVDYLKAQAISQGLGYLYLATLYGSLLQELDTIKATLQRAQNENQSLTAKNMFDPKVPRDVLVTDYFTLGGANPQNLALVEQAVKELKDWQARMQEQGLAVQDLNPADLSIQGTLAQMKDDLNAALTKYLEAVQLLEQDRRNLRDEQTRSAFMEDKMDFYYNPALILLHQKRYAEAFALFEESRSRAMADMLASRPLTLGTPRDRALFSELQSQKTAIAALQEKLFNLTSGAERDKNGKQIVDLQTQITGLQQKYRALESTIASEAPKLNQLTSSKPVTLESAQREAAQGGYDILYYAVLGTGIILWHVNGSEVEVKNVFLPHSVLTTKTAAFHDSLVSPRDSPGASFNNDISRQLYLYLIQPVAAFIKSDHLIIVPHEELTSIPFQALLNPADGKYLGERFNISYAPSATVLATLERKPNLENGRLLAIADPEIHDAGDEVRSIGALYPGRSKVVAQDPVSKADVGAWVGNYNLIHLSVHGKFNASDPLLSYLQFRTAPSDDGRLTAAEMFGLPLEKNSLVVLSACETGRVEATHTGELLGMVRSLLYAGAGDLVLSSWEVNAASTKLWMTTFYREGQTREPAEAARLALLAVKSQPEFNHPFFWAPFVLTGK